MNFLTFPPPVLTGSGSTGPLSHLSSHEPPEVAPTYAASSSAASAVFLFATNIPGGLGDWSPNGSDCA